jgi:hypothetical protein
MTSGVEFLPDDFGRVICDPLVRELMCHISVMSIHINLF